MYLFISLFICFAWPEVVPFEGIEMILYLPSAHLYLMRCKEDTRPTASEGCWVLLPQPSDNTDQETADQLSRTTPLADLGVGLGLMTSAFLKSRLSVWKFSKPFLIEFTVSSWTLLTHLTSLFLTVTNQSLLLYNNRRLWNYS